ncbi:RNA-binding protein 4B-like [Gambusia affinis]|uniref:RNA-binding protein 4B-like n=1 Tax=Gambusia affinis TaxID=33528 RepID=UPI001CDD22D4|nr:RNA-binding protein 4B-like [Gambusia affinis]
MVKIFIGNLSPETTREDIEELFVKYGIVTECAKYKNYAFVHMEDRKSATKAIRELHLHKLNGRSINVEPSRGKNQGPVKLHIANVEKGFDKELRDLFEEFGTVTECSIVKNFAFVHMPHYEEAMDALEGLDNLEFQGKRIHVQVSKSRPRGGPEEEEEQYPPPPVRGGYYPPYYPMPRPEPPYRGRLSAYPPPPPPPPPLPPPPPMRRAAYPDHGYSDRAPYGSVDYYEKYRARPFTAATIYDDRRAIPPPPPPSSALVRERLGATPSVDPYERRALPTPAAYAARDRSPIRRIPPPPAPAAGNGYSYERSRLSPMSRAPLYAAPRTREPYAGRVPPPLPPRYTGY